jgi:uncharacterized RDD family membrane protein YckC
MSGQLRTVTTKSKASFSRRLVAFLIDGIIIAILSAIVAEIFELNRIEGYWFNMISFFTYNIVMDYTSMGTIGKIYLNIAVVGTDGRTPRLPNCIFRNLGKIISGIPLWYGFVRILAPHVRQTLHDELSRCYVVER